MNDRFIRVGLGLFAVLAALSVIYASIVPLKYSPISWRETWLRFQEIPWYELGLQKRADWVANGLIMIPFGFFTTGAVHWKRSSSQLALLSFVLFGLLLATFICAVEFVQIWFPPRVLSQNDMLAGFIGGLAGWAIWHMAGSGFIVWILAFVRSKPGLTRIAMLANFCAVGMLIFGLMPFDIMLTGAEWDRKIELDRIVWLPFSDWSGAKQSAKSILLSAWAFPLGLVLGQRLETKKAMFRVGLWCVAIELASLPVFSHTFSSTDIVAPLIIGCFGVAFSTPVMRFASRFDAPASWILAAVVWTSVLLVGFTFRYQRIVLDSTEWRERLWGIWAIPFARAHRSSEFEAAENILLKLLVFAMLAFFLMGWHNRCGGSAKLRTLVVTVWFAGIAMAVELAQVFLYPLVPDVTDVLLYTLGGAIGMAGFLILIPVKAPSRLTPSPAAR